MNILSVHATYKKMQLNELESWTKLDKEFLSSFLKNDSIEGHVVLKTCNRLEVYMSVNDPENVKTAFLNLSKRLNSSNLLFLQNLDSIRHIMRVCAGLDSMIIGEQEVQRQVKEALEEARKAKHSGKMLNYIFMKVLNTGKEIRQKTKVANGITSVSQLAAKILNDRINATGPKKVCIVGTGKVASTLIKCVNSIKADVTLCGRNKPALKEFSKEFGVKCLPMEEFKITDFDYVITAVSSPTPIIKVTPGPKMPSLIIDLGNPRNVDIKAQENYIDLESLNAFVAKNMKLRENEISKAERIIDKNVVVASKKLMKLEREGQIPLQMAA